MTHHDFQHDFDAQAVRLLNQLLAVADVCAPDRCPDPLIVGDPSHSGTCSAFFDRESRERAEASLPALTIGLPWLSRECSLRWCGLRLFWWPRGIPSLRRCGIVSSRPGRPRYEQKAWFAGLRSLVGELNPLRDCVVVDSSVWAYRVAERAADLASVSILKFCDTGRRPRCSRDRECLRKWLVQRLRSPRNSDEKSEASCHGNVWPVHVSPVLSRETSPSSEEAELVCRPLPDRLLFASSEMIRVLHCRHGGHTESLIRDHRNDPDRRRVSISVFTGDNAEKTKQCEKSRNSRSQWSVVRTGGDSLMGQRSGAESGTFGMPSNDVTETEGFTREPVTESGISCPFRHPADWLLHWTRACDGPWPRQSETEWLEELITCSSSADHSVFATLKRIVNQEKLTASRCAIRGRYAVVCFTEVPLNEFGARRTFRRHRRRHDFEPWGVAVRRSALASLGARPVLYGDESVWEKMPESDRPFFQRANSGGDRKSGQRISGWETEREWRLIGDLDLRRIPQADVCWFVPDAESARQLSERTDRRVIVVPPSGCPGRISRLRHR